MILIDDTECPNIPRNAPRPLLLPVGQWKDTAAINYLSNRQIRDSRVEFITWYKNTGGLEHEYLVVECHRPEGVIFHLRIERQPANHNQLSVPEGVSPSETNGPTSVQQQLSRKKFRKGIWIILQKMSYRLQPKVAALDSVSQALESTGSFGEEAREIAQFHEFREPLFVRDLAFLSDTVHSHQPNYQVFLYQCYWYCRTIIDVVNAEYQPTIIQGEHFREAGTYMIRKRWLGSHRVTVNQPCGNEVDQIREDFKAALESHNTQVQQRENKRNGTQQNLERRLEEARRREGLAGSHV